MRFLLALVLVGAVLVPASLTFAQSTGNYCATGQSPTFQLGFADLKARLGSDMGDPSECEHANILNGDTLQHTTTGLAFYRKSTNTPTFTNGYQHWGITPAGLVTWTGDTVDPPPLSDAEVQYIATVRDLAYQQQTIRREFGNAIFSNDAKTFRDGVFQTDDDLRALQSWFSTISAPPRLAQIDSLFRQGLDEYGQGLAWYRTALDSGVDLYYDQAKPHFTASDLLFSQGTEAINAFRSSLAPPTPTWTPLPTRTPLPTFTPLPTLLPLVATATPIPDQVPFTVSAGTAHPDPDSSLPGAFVSDRFTLSGGSYTVGYSTKVRVGSSCGFTASLYPGRQSLGFSSYTTVVKATTPFYAAANTYQIKGVGTCDWSLTLSRA